jgi:hypothetical protein
MKVPKAPKAVHNERGGYATPSLLCAVQSLMQQALLKGRSTHPIAPAVPACCHASVPIIPTHVLDRSLNDANQITYLVICRKVKTCKIYNADTSSAASAFFRRLRVNQMAISASSYKMHKGIASSSCDTTSGGVRTAAMAKAPTMA